MNTENVPILVNGQHVEVGDVVLMSVYDSLATFLLINQLSNVLIHKLTL